MKAWPGMPKREFARLQVELRELADALGLKDTVVVLSPHPIDPDEDAGTAADNRIAEGQRRVRVRLAMEFAAYDRQRKRQILAHELLHVHLDGVRRSMQLLEEALPKDQWELIWKFLDNEIELAVDNLALVLERHL